MLFLIEREVKNVYVFVVSGRTLRIEEVLSFDFIDKDYKLSDFTIEEVEHLKGGEKNG